MLCDCDFSNGQMSYSRKSKRRVLEDVLFFLTSAGDMMQQLERSVQYIPDDYDVGLLTRIRGKSAQITRETIRMETEFSRRLLETGPNPDTSP